MTAKSGVLSLSQSAKDSFQITFEQGHDYFKSMHEGFGANCNERIICGASSDESDNNLNNGVESITVE